MSDFLLDLGFGLFSISCGIYIGAEAYQKGIANQLCAQCVAIGVVCLIASYIAFKCGRKSK